MSGVLGRLGRRRPQLDVRATPAVAGVVPDYLYGGAAIPQLPLGPLSVGQGMAIEAIKGAPSEASPNSVRDESGDDAETTDVQKKKSTETFWERNAVSLSTCYPGATEPALVRRQLLLGFGNVPFRLVLQMATLFAPGGLSDARRGAGAA